MNEHFGRSLAPDVGAFLFGSLLVFATVHVGVPSLTAAGLEPMAAWMLLAVPLIYIPLIVAGILVLRAEGGQGDWRGRLRLERPSARDWLWGLGGIGGVAVGSVAALALCTSLGLDPSPPFARDVDAVTADRWWLVALWGVYWPFNILGEEFLWRGVLLPRMEERLGGSAWLANAALWGVFHAAFGIGNNLVLIPTLLLVPLVAQRRRSTWLAVMIHGGLSLPGFVSLALGVGP